MVLLLLGLTWHLEERNDFTLNGRIKEGERTQKEKARPLCWAAYIDYYSTSENFFDFFKTKAFHAECAEYWQLVQCV